MKKLLIVALCIFGFAAVAYAAPTYRVERTILPETTSTYELGTSTKTWLRGFFDNLCLGGVCNSSWPSGGGGSISTSTIPTAGHVAYWTSASALSGTATTTLTGTAPITFSQPINVLGSAASVITCADATGAAKGCLTAADYLTFGNKLGTTSIDSLAELESIAGVTNILIENDIDASSELAAIMDDETGSGALVFGTSPTFSFPNMSGATLNGTTTLVNATTTTFAITGLTSELLMVDGNGSVLEALAGTNYEVPVTAGDGLTRTVNDFDCDNASASAFGCLTSVDYLLFGNKLGSTSIDSLAEIEAIAGVTNILIENDIDASSELAAIMDDETGTGALVFGTGSSLSSTTLTNATATVIFATTATSTNLFSTHATTSSFAANIICLLGDCRTAWPTSGAGGGSNWTYVVGTPSYISPSTTVGTLISASSTIGAGTQQGGLTIYGGATTTGNSTILGTLTLSTALTVANGGTGSTTLSGILKGAGTGAIETAVADSDYQVPLTFGDGLTRTANDIDCDTATAAAFGCLAAVDYLAFGNKLGTTSIDSLAEIESIAGVTNILIENDIDASSELLAIMDDETGTGALVFGTSPTFSFPIMSGATLNGTTTLVNATSTTFFTQFASTTQATSTYSFTHVASTTDFFGAGLTECSDAGDTLAWNAGRFSCGSDAEGVGGSGGSNWTYVSGTQNYITPSTTVGTLISASSTIGGGTQQTGLTIYGGATTTGSLVLPNGDATLPALTFANALGQGVYYSSDDLIVENTADKVILNAGDSVFTFGTDTANFGGANITNVATISTQSITLSAATPNMLLSTNAISGVTATATPQVGAIFATSTTATSSFASGLLVGLGAANYPSVSFIGDTDTGIYSSGGNSINFASAGTARFSISSGTFAANTGSGPAIINLGASASSPNILPSRAVTTTGFNSCTSGQICTIMGGLEQSRWGRNGYGVATDTPSSLLSTGMSTATSTFTAWMSGSSSPAFFIGSANQNGNIGIGTSTLTKKLNVQGEAQFQGDTAATSTVYIDSTASGKGGRIILKDTNGTTCTEITTLSGATAVKAVTCP